MSDHDDETTPGEYEENAMIMRISPRNQKPASPSGLDSARVDEIRRRIANRAYDHPAMIAELARRILASGDL